jgi:hypothetical protein
VGNANAHQQLLNEAHALRLAMEKKLWATTAVEALMPIGRGGNDHFVTAMMDDERTFYDMVDYDANLIAVVSVLVQSQPAGVVLFAIESSCDEHLHACLLLTGDQAHGTPANVTLARRVLARIDRGNCTAVRGAGPQFVSEGCYDTNHPTGDCAEGDWCSMGRIGYYDGLARKRLGMQ